MKKYVYIILISTLFSMQCFADNYESFQGRITAIDDVLAGYSNVSGGLLFITMNGTGCEGFKFWFDDDGVKSKNLLSLSMTALTTGKQVRLIYDELLAFYGSNGKIHRITIYQ